MAPRVVWLDRIDPLIHRVKNSIRSHYDREELTNLFELQRRSMFSLLACLPTVHVGRSILVEKEALLKFLERLRNAKDAGAELAAIRKQGKPTPPRRKMRDYTRAEVAGKLNDLPGTITFAPGELRVSFQSIEQLAFALYSLAEVMRGPDLETIAQHYEPKMEPTAEELALRQAEADDVAYFASWER